VVRDAPPKPTSEPVLYTSITITRSTLVPLPLDGSPDRVNFSPIPHKKRLRNPGFNCSKTVWFRTSERCALYFQVLYYGASLGGDFTRSDEPIGSISQQICITSYQIPIFRSEFITDFADRPRSPPDAAANGETPGRPSHRHSPHQSRRPRDNPR
jgi:hypothetical protein